MEVVYKEKGNVKTHDLIKMSAEKGMPIVCLTKVEAMIIEKEAEKIGVKIEKPISSFELPTRNYRGKVLVDNAEYVLAALIGNPVEAITITKQ